MSDPQIVDIVLLQMAPVIDGLHKDFTSRSRMPYPLFMDKNGMIQAQDLWNGEVYKVIGFTDRPEPGNLTVHTDEVFASPEKVIGKYLVTSDMAGQWSVHQTAVVESTHGQVRYTPRHLNQIAQQIRKDWGPKMYFGAVPYVEAMLSLRSIDEKYGDDRAKDIVNYFLANARTWRGEIARQVKAELKRMAA